MVSNVNGAPQNVALEPTGPRPVDPATEAQQREKDREVIQDQDAVRVAKESEPAHPDAPKPKTVDRYA